MSFLRSVTAQGARLRERLTRRRDTRSLTIIALRAATRWRRAHPQLRMRLGLELADADRWGEAADAFAAAVALDDGHVAWHSWRGEASARSGRWEEAADAYAAAAALDRRCATWQFQRGEALARARRWDEAAAAFEATVALDSGHAKAHFRLGRMHHRSGRWEEAADAYRAAIALDGTVVRWREQLARLLRLMGETDEVQRVSADILRHSRNVTPTERVLLEADPYRFRVRRRLLRFVTDHMDEIRDGAADVTPDPAHASARVWMYWGQGMAHAPDIVRRCHRALLEHHDADQIIVLDDDDLDRYVDIPGYIRDRTSDDRTKFSDVLRLELLARHGGVWLDATCLVRRNLLDLLPDLLTAGFFAPRARPARIASWFLASDPGGHIMTTLLSAQRAYWRHHDTPIDYFVLHHLFEALSHTDATVAASCERMPMVPAADLQRFAQRMLDPYDPDAYHALIDSAPVHKLTYKKLRSTQDLTGTMVGRLLEDGALAAGALAR